MVTVLRPICAAPDCRKRARPHARYCSNTCRQRMARRRQRERAAEQAALTPARLLISRALADVETPDDVIAHFLARRGEIAALNASAGPAFERVMGTPKVLEGLLRNTMDFRTAGELLGFAPSTVAKVMEEIAQRLRVERAAVGWQVPADAARLAGMDLDLRLDPGYYAGWSPERLEALIAETVDRFVAWRACFCADERGTPYLTKAFHRRWIRHMLSSLLRGQRTMILSPPRHGKTQLLIDFCLWLIVRFPNIRLLWIAANADLAGDWLAALEDQLDNNPRLREAYLEPGAEWHPGPRSGRTWSRKSFTVATRRVTGIKSPTMQAVGRGGRILSRDVDFMVVDDIEDDESVETPGSRAKTRKWFTLTAGGRKMEHTGVVVLGSRQDPDDLYGYLIDNVEWSCQVEEAHSSACELPVHDEAAHVDCMLFPEVRSFRWLASQRRSMALEGGDELFEMQYLNRPIPRGLLVFDETAMRACCSTRLLGDVPGGCRLVAGLDPSVAGYQAAFLWAFQIDTQRLFMVDLVVDTGPGIPGFLEVLAAWTSRYPTLWDWVVEENAFQRGYITDSEVRRFRMEHNLRITGHQTQTNKWDRNVGVGSLARMFSATVPVQLSEYGTPETCHMVDLPYGDPEAQAKVDHYIRQAKYFASAGSGERGSTRSGYKSDALMASWFPMKLIRAWRSEWSSQVVSIGYQPSYASFQRTTWETVPWR